MSESISSKTLWDGAGKAGLVLGGISIVYYVANSLLTTGISSTVLASLFSLVLWIVKFSACIYLMKFFMARFAAGNEGVTNNTSFKFGVVTALLSALLYSAFCLLFTTVIYPDMLSDTMETAMQSYASVLSSSELERLENLSENLPTMIFFFNLVYCFLFGTVLSSIFSRNIPPRNPFSTTEDKVDEQW